MIEIVVNFSEPSERKGFIALLSPLTGKQTVIVKRYQAPRTSPQNRYYWGVVLKTFVDYRKEQGEAFDAQQAHEMFGRMFLPLDIWMGDEVVETTRRSTRALTVGEFSEYLEKVIAWLAYWDIQVPPAGSPQAEAMQSGANNNDIERESVAA
jgi:hypothetical protein